MTSPICPCCQNLGVLPTKNGTTDPTVAAALCDACLVAATRGDTGVHPHRLSVAIRRGRRK